MSQEQTTRPSKRFKWGGVSPNTPPEPSFNNDNQRVKQLSTLMPSLTSTPTVLQNDPKKFELAFVNRADIAYKVAGALVDSATYDHGLLVHIGQHNGSGKTTFVRNLKKIMDKQNLWEQLKHQKAAREHVIENLKKSTYVEVRCNNFMCHDTEIGERRIRQKLYIQYLLWAIQENFNISDQITPEKCRTISGVVRALLKFHPEKTFLIHWDEVESIQRLYKADSQKSSFSEEMRRYYELWEELKDALKSETCFHILTSKSTAFSLIGLQLIRNIVKESPSVPMPFLLNPLSEEHVSLILDNTLILMKGRELTISNWFRELNLNDSDRPYLVQLMVNRTGGVPRLVRESLRAILDLNPVLDSPEHIQHLLDHEVYTTIKNICAKEISLDGDLDRRVSRLLVLLTALNISLPRTYYFRIGSHKIPLLRLLTIGNIYVRPSNDDKIQLIMPQYSIRYFREENTSKPDIVLGLADALLEGDIIDKGALLERGLLYALLLQLLVHMESSGSKQYWASLFNGKIFAQSKVLQNVPIKLLTSSQFVKLLPKVTSSRKTALSASELETLQTTPGKVNLNQFQFSQMILNLLPAYCAAFSTSKSGTSDAMVRADFKKMCNIASKFTHKVGAPTIQEEIDKGSIVLKADKELEVCLVVACASVCKYINDVVPTDTGALVLPSGVYKFENGTCKRINDSTTYYEAVSPTKLYCVCQKPYMFGDDMIQCDNCNEWYHLKCLNIYDQRPNDYDKFYCGHCSSDTLQSTFRDIDDDSNDCDYYDGFNYDNDHEDPDDDISIVNTHDINHNNQSTRTIDVPHRMELIILNSKGLEIWVGAETLQVYKDTTNESARTENDVTNALINMMAPILPGYSHVKTPVVDYKSSTIDGIAHSLGSGTSGVPSESVEAHVQLQTIKISNGKVIRDIQVESSKTLEEIRKSVGPKAIKDLEPSQVLTYVDMKITDPNIRVSSLKEGSIIYFEQVGEEW